jgi:hypothetical protein
MASDFAGQADAPGALSHFLISDGMPGDTFRELAR